MADRYWVGGSGTWDATTTTNWATSTGGAGGASAPTSADNVIFDANSNTGTSAFTVTVTGTSVAPASCLNFSTGGAGGALDGVMTIATAIANTIDVYGSLTFPVTNLAFSQSGASSIFRFRSTTTGNTVTTNGIDVGNLGFTFDGVGGEWTLGSAFLTTTTTRGINVINGTFNTGNYNLTMGPLNINAVGTQTVNLGSSTISIGASAATPINFTETAGLTFNAGTSTITCTAASPTFVGGGQTFYNVSFTSAGAGTTTITGANTFNDLNQTSRSASGVRVVAFGANQTVSGTLTLGAANTSVRRIHVQSDVIGTQRTITLNGSLATLADVDFRNIVTAGSVSRPWTGTRLGNGLGNSGITFAAAKDVYWNLAAGQSWFATVWALTSGGAVDANNFPLAQDKAIIEDTGLNSGATVTYTTASWWVGEIDISTRTLPMTFGNGNVPPIVYKNVTLSSAVTMTGTAAWSFFGQGTTQILDTNTATFVPPINIDSPSGTLQLAENTTCSGTVTLTRGTLDINNNVLTANAVSSSNSNTRVIAFGTGNITLTGNGATIWNTGTVTNFSYTGAPTVNATYSGATGTRTITASALTDSVAISFNISAGSDVVAIGGASQGTKNLNFTGFSGVFSNIARNIWGNLIFSSGMTCSAGTGTTFFLATSGTQQVTTNGVTLDFPITQNGVGGTVQLQDNLTMGSTRTYTLTNGSLDLNDKTLNCGLFNSNNTNTRTLDLGTDGKIEVTGTSFTVNPSGLTMSGTGIVSMDSATTKTFAGGGGVYPYALNQGGIGNLTITGANTFQDMTNTVQPCTIIFPASTTTSVYNFNVNGTDGNLVLLRSSTPGTRYTLARLV